MVAPTRAQRDLKIAPDAPISEPMSANGASAAHPEFGGPGEIPLSPETRQKRLDDLRSDPETRGRLDRAVKRAEARAAAKGKPTAK